MLVKMLVHTFYDGRPLGIGDMPDVPDTVAGRWISRRIAEIVDDDDGVPPIRLPLEELEQLSPEQLLNYAQAHQVEVGRATTDKGILEKIMEAGKVFTKMEE